MTVFIDPPRWPAHGTVFSHMISDRSIQELHLFAATLGMSRRAFDLDHYDVPAHRYDDARTAGAVPVEGKELVRVLVASGLRVPARGRTKRLALTLQHRWDHHFPGQSRLGAELLQRWSEPHRAYHDLRHLLRVLESIDLLTDAREHPELVAAAWFHDAVHEGRAGHDEQRSADLALDRLTTAGWARDKAHRVAELVLVTVDHSPADSDHDAQLLVDADLAILGTDERTYAEYAAAVRREYAHVSDVDFAAARCEILAALLTKQPLFHSARAVALWETTARHNVLREISELRQSLRA